MGQINKYFCPHKKNRTVVYNYKIGLTNSASNFGGKLTKKGVGIVNSAVKQPFSYDNGRVTGF